MDTFSDSFSKSDLLRLPPNGSAHYWAHPWRQMYVGPILPPPIPLIDETHEQLCIVPSLLIRFLSPFTVSGEAVCAHKKKPDLFINGEEREAAGVSTKVAVDMQGEQNVCTKASILRTRRKRAMYSNYYKRNESNKKKKSRAVAGVDAFAFCADNPLTLSRRRRCPLCPHTDSALLMAMATIERGGFQKPTAWLWRCVAVSKAGEFGERLEDNDVCKTGYVIDVAGLKTFAQTN